MRVQCRPCLQQPMRTSIYLCILLVAAAALRARPRHGYWPYMSQASCDVLLTIAAALCTLLLWLGIADWKRPPRRDWETWCALLAALVGVAYALLPAVQ